MLKCLIILKRKAKKIARSCMGKSYRKYTFEMCEWLKANHQGKTRNQVAEEMSKKFNKNITVGDISNLKRTIYLRDGFIFEKAVNTGYFKKGHYPTNAYKKGHVPVNKGLKWDEYLTKEQQQKSLKTTYKKGHKSHNAVNVGDEAMRCTSHDEGYVYVKVCDGKLNKNWKPKQQVIWEKKYGEVPKGHKVIFLDGNRFNFDINNLAIVTNGEELHINKLNLVSGNPELKKTAVLAVKTRFKTLEKERNMKNEELYLYK